ncbi:MAG: AAA family ATPase [Candidatus Komeilibacteria bacterium]
MNKLVCIVGMTGSGKSEVADYFVNHGYTYVRFGQITLDEVREKNLEPIEENERPIREKNRKEHGPAAYAILNMPKFEAGLAKGNVIGDGLYSWSEYKYLKEKFGEDLVIIAIYAAPETRYARLADRRSRYVEDDKMKYRSSSPEQAKSRDYAEIENIEKAGPIAMADYTILNEGSLVELKSQIKETYRKINE